MATPQTLHPDNGYEESKMSQTNLTWIRKLRPREIRHLGQGHTVSQGHRAWYMNIIVNNFTPATRGQRARSS